MKSRSANFLRRESHLNLGVPLWRQSKLLRYSGLFSMSLTWRSAWFRIFGYGLSIRDLETYYPMFSERQGIRGLMRIGRIGVNVLRPD